MFEWLFSESVRLATKGREAERDARRFISGSAKEIEPERERLVNTMLAQRRKFDPTLLQYFSDEEVIDLGTAHTNLRIWERGGRGLYITSFDGDPLNTSIRFNNPAASLYPVRVGYIKGAFRSIYLVNTAQVISSTRNYHLKFVVSYRNFAEYHLLEDPTVPKREYPYTITMTTENTEYDQAIPDHTKKIMFRCRDGTAIKYAFQKSHVAGIGDLYSTLLANGRYSEGGFDLCGITLCFACGTAGKKVELRCMV